MQRDTKITNCTLIKNSPKLTKLDKLRNSLYTTFDKAMTQIMLKAEKRVAQAHTEPWNPRLYKVFQQVKQKTKILRKKKFNTANEVSNKETQTKLKRTIVQLRKK